MASPPPRESSGVTFVPVRQHAWQSQRVPKRLQLRAPQRGQGVRGAAGSGAGSRALDVVAIIVASSLAL
jgi:hypothetical protein